MKEHSTRLQDVRTELQEVQDRIQRIEDDLRWLAEEAGPASGNGHSGLPGLDLTHINDSLRELGEQDSQEDILAVYLRQCEPFLQRGVLFLRQDSRYLAWKSLGFDDDEVADVEVEADNNAIVRAAELRVTLDEEDDLEESLPWLDADSLPRRSLCVPLVFGDSAPVVLYADNGYDGELDRASLELLTQLAVLVLKNQYLTYLSLEPNSIGDIEVAGLGRGSQREGTAEMALGTPESSENGWDQLKASGRAERPKPKVIDGDDDPVIGGIPPFGEALDDDDSEAEIEAADDDSWEDVAALSEDKSWDAGESTAEDLEADAQEAADEAIEEAELAAREALENAGDTDRETLLGASDLEDEAEAEDDGGGLEASGAEEVEATDEPADEASGGWLKDRLHESGDAAAETDAIARTLRTASQDSEEEAPHSEARRFARLLVSEIKLYNVDAIEQGRREKDLYQRLQRDIDRSRDMYEKRVHPSVRRETDYFHEEVLRILAAGDQAALGSGYPGPQIEAV